MRVPRGFWLGLAATVVSAGLLLGPALGAPGTRLVGDFQTEMSTHAPQLAAALEGLLHHGPFVLADHPLHADEVTGAMYEPITTLGMWPFYELAGRGIRGFTFAWNAWNLVVLVGTSLGAWLWARAWLGDERDPGGWGAGAAMAVASASLAVHFAPEVGRTESVAYPLYALHGGLLFRAVRRGGAAWIGAALSVVPIVWAGGYACVFFGVAEPLVALWALTLAPKRKPVIVGLAGVAAVTALAAAPLAWALKAHPYIGLTEEAGRMDSPSVALGVLVGMTDNLLRELPGYEMAPFAGWVTLLVAVLAVARLRAAAWPLAIGGVLYLTAAGPHPTLHGTTLTGPAALLGGLPDPVGVVRGWSRLLGFAVPLFAVAAAALGRGRAAVAGLVAAGALVETGVRRVQPAPWWSLEEPPGLVALRAAHEVPILLPFDSLERTRRWLGVVNVPDVWKVQSDHDLFKYFQDALPNEPELFRNKTVKPAVDYDVCALRADAVSLGVLGFTVLYLRDDFLPEDGRGIAVRALKEVFGPPREAGVWDLPAEVGKRCLTAADGGEAVAPIQVRGDDVGGGPKSEPRTPEERAARRAERAAERERMRVERLKAKGGGRP